MDRTNIARRLRQGGAGLALAGALAVAAGAALGRRHPRFSTAAAEAELEARAHRLFRRAQRGMERDSFYLFAPELKRLEHLHRVVRMEAQAPAAELIGVLLDLQRATERGPLGETGRRYFLERVGRAYLALLDGLGLHVEAEERRPGEGATP